MHLSETALVAEALLGHQPTFASRSPFGCHRRPSLSALASLDEGSPDDQSQVSRDGPAQPADELTLGRPWGDGLVMADPPTWSIERRGNIVTARFEGRLLPDEGKRSAKEFVRVVGTDSVRALLDVRRMSGYDSAARREWINILTPIRSQIEEITLRGGNSMVRMGGSVLGAMLGVPIRTID